ncbi:MAG: hypothetical protein EBV86_05490 [Marivivens sp.]|nr:hypothetical protein [Marivivens sp.]
MWTYNGKRIREGRAWTDDNGTQHPANWSVWSEAEKTALGLVWVAPQQKPDERFYWVTQNVDGTYTSTERSLEDVNEVDENGDPLLNADGVQMVTKGLKSNWIAKIKQTQGNLLSQTDWAYIRKTDTGIAVPADIQTYRDEVRLAAGTIEGQIAACADLDAFKALFEAPVDADGNPTGNAPIYNWPDAI